jgi:hypothetical protein
MPNPRRQVVQPVDGDNFLFRVFDELLELDDEISNRIVDYMVESAAIWFHPNVYSSMPVFLPWVVRDAKCRPHVRAGKQYPDQWGAPDADGFLRDDNSLIKGIPKSLPIISPTNAHLDGRRLGKSWVAAHVWREVNLDQLASRDPRLNSFVPNLVWLPRQIAKLSDHEGGLLQNALKRASWSLYRNVEVRHSIRDRVEEIWKLLPPVTPTERASNLKFNYFGDDQKLLKSRAVSLKTTTSLIHAILNKGELPPKRRTPPRYYEGLQRIPLPKLQVLYSRLEPFERSITESLKDESAK